MGLFDDLSQFLESRLEEFLQKNPHLELERLLEQLRQQEEDILKLISELKLKEKRSQDKILETAQEIQKWHVRIEKAKNAGRFDLASAAQERETALLRQGNQLWGNMEGIKERIVQAKELLVKVQQRRQEVQAASAQAQAQRTASAAKQRLHTENSGWEYQSSGYSDGLDDLEEQFQRWETDDELERMKKNMGK